VAFVLFVLNNLKQIIIMIQRIAPSQIETDLPLRNAMEACWHAFQRYGIQGSVIDMAAGKVQGFKGASLSSYGQTFTAQFEVTPYGHRITVKIEDWMQGNIDFGKKKREIAKIADSIAGELQVAPTIANDTPRPVELAKPISPIAAPTGGPLIMGSSGPAYGTASPPKRGTGILIYGLLGVSCCQIAAPFALVYGLQALKKYKTEDGGDRGMVLTGTILGGIGVLILIARIAIIASSAIR